MQLEAELCNLREDLPNEKEKKYRVLKDHADNLKNYLHDKKRNTPIDELERLRRKLETLQIQLEARRKVLGQLPRGVGVDGCGGLVPRLEVEPPRRGAEHFSFGLAIWLLSTASWRRRSAHLARVALPTSALRLRDFNI